jgi:hypothetical protein
MFKKQVLLVIFLGSVLSDISWATGPVAPTPLPLTWRISILNDTGVTNYRDFYSDDVEWWWFDNTIDYGNRINENNNDDDTVWWRDSGLVRFLIQDAGVGRDLSFKDDSDGAAGFSFTKLDTWGNALPNNAPEWVCVRDNVTGLVWEVKTDDNGLHDRQNTYSWLLGNDAFLADAAASVNGGNCKESACDTRGFISAVRAIRPDPNNQTLGFCGQAPNSWRLPQPYELLSLVHYGTYDPAIDEIYFPNVRFSGDDQLSAKYWTAIQNADGSRRYALFVDFVRGDLSYESMTQARYVRLVSGPAVVQMQTTTDPWCFADIFASTPNTRFINNQNNTITDLATGLTWKRCVEGLQGTNCEQWVPTPGAVQAVAARTQPFTFTWREALWWAAQLNATGGFAGATDWRVPNVKELASLVEQQCTNPAINTELFPNTPLFEWYWSSTPDADWPGYAWGVNFNNGQVDYHINISHRRYLRLVRGGHITRPLTP